MQKQMNIEKLIASYLEDSISREELEILKKWVSIKTNENSFREFVYEYYQENTFDTEKAFELFESKIGKSDIVSMPYQASKRFAFIKYAAIFVGVLTTGYFGYLIYEEPVGIIPTTEVTLEVEGGGVQILDASNTKTITTENGEVVAKQNGNVVNYANSSMDNAETVYNILKVPFGKTFQIELSDKTYIYLNAGSSLRYPASFASNQPREVFLEGEGYFKVSKKNGKSPFIVRANGIGAEVFGTEFNISSYLEDKRSKVVLVEGSLGVFDDGNRFDPESNDLILKQNEMASKVGDVPIKMKKVDVGDYISWINGTLLFKNEDFNSIIRKLERHYDITITNNYKALEEKKFTGRFDIETVERILIAFQKVNKFNYVVQGDHIIINP